MRTLKSEILNVYLGGPPVKYRGMVPGVMAAPLFSTSPFTECALSPRSEGACCGPRDRSKLGPKSIWHNMLSVQFFLKSRCTLDYTLDGSPV